MTTVVTDHDFLALVEPLRRELIAHCYRMLGSVHDAEDQVQETYLRAWRGYGRFEGRSSVRTWMYQIATNTCLTHLEGRARRPLPTGLGAPASAPDGPLESRSEITWLEPLPDRLVGVGTTPTDPEAIALTSENIRLAFIAALQHLTPQQRAVLILRDVLQWRASEVAAVLDTSVAAVNSLLQRARAHVDDLAPRADASVTVDDPAVRAQLERYVAAFEAYDIQGIVALLTKDAVWDMPPFTGWYQGREAIGVLIATNCPAQGPGDMRLVATSGANGQPAYAVYMREQDGVHRAFQIQQLTLAGGGVSAVTTYFDLDLFDAFGLPRELDRDTGDIPAPLAGEDASWVGSSGSGP